MDWVVHYFDRRLNRECVSRSYATREDALRNACDLKRQNCEVSYIQGPNDERIAAPAIYAWCKGHRSTEHPRDHRIDIALDQDRLAKWVDGERCEIQLNASSQSDAGSHLVVLTIRAQLKRAGKEMKIIVENGSDPTTPDASLLRVLIRGFKIRERLFEDKGLTLDEIAKSEGMVPSYATRLLRLTLLAPDIVGAILSGRQPPELTARRLMDDTRLPLDWSEQRRELGFA